MATNTNISKKRKFVADGLFYAELNEFLQNELGEDGYAGVEVRVTPMRTEIIIRATRTQNVLGEKGRRIRELTSLVAKRFLFPEGNVELYAERVQNRALSAIAQAESLRFKLLGGLAVRRACYGVMRYVMENGAKGVEVVISGKLRAARAKAMKFRDGYMIKSGDAVNHYIDFAVRHIQLKQVRKNNNTRAQRTQHDSTAAGRAALANEPKTDPPALFLVYFRVFSLFRVCWESRLRFSSLMTPLARTVWPPSPPTLSPSSTPRRMCPSLSVPQHNTRVAFGSLRCTVQSEDNGAEL